MMLAGEIVLLAGLVILAKIGLMARHEQLEGMVGLVFGLVAHVIAIMLYLSIANEYRNVRNRDCDSRGDRCAANDHVVTR